jgi:hypothetical protein
VYLRVNAVSIVARKLRKLNQQFSFGNTFPAQPIRHYIGKVFWFYLIRELYLNAGLGR